jgi:nicotinamide mononucleotide (NMN) deamidase PncC
MGGTDLAELSTAQGHIVSVTEVCTCGLVGYLVGTAPALKSVSWGFPTT